MTYRPSQVFARLSQGITDQRWSDLAEFYAEDVVVEMPFAAPAPTRLHGREEVRTQFVAAAQGPLSLRARNVVVHETTDPEVIVAEYDYVGHVATTATTFRVANIQVLRIRDGLIVESHDYHDHLAIAHALGHLPQLTAAMSSQSHPAPDDHEATAPA
jgi:uncharacterized protein